MTNGVPSTSPSASAGIVTVSCAAGIESGIACWVSSSRRSPSAAVTPPPTATTPATAPDVTRNRRRSHPSGARDRSGVRRGPGGRGSNFARTAMPASAPSSGAGIAPADSSGRLTAQTAPNSPNAAMPAVPTQCRRIEATPSTTATIARITAMPMRSAVLSSVPNALLPSSISQAGA
ncbi:MAG: hypothetical protein QM733_16465 [Ilumatobacteraceae bacterium]